MGKITKKTNFKTYLAWFGVFGAFNGYYSVGALPIGYKFKLAAQLLYGYGFVTPFAFEYDQTNLNCGSKELESVLEVVSKYFNCTCILQIWVDFL